MQRVLNKAYNDFLGAIDSIANCSNDGAVLPHLEEEMTPLQTQPNYVYPCDNYINSILDSKLVINTLHTIARRYYGGQIADVMQRSTLLTKDNYPGLYANYKNCCSTLCINKPPAVYVTSTLQGINALSVEIEYKAVILVSYMAVVVLSDLEQRFLLGHELGHIQQGHMVVHTLQGLLLDLNKRAELLGPIVTDLLDVPLNRWYRASEFTADRAGYLCCGELAAVKHLFARLGQDAPISAYERYCELSEAYPSVGLRLELISQYSRNEKKI